MTQEDKELLLVDLCARLPYGVKCQFEDTIRLIDGEGESFYDYTLSARHLDLFINHANFYIKPYLRPMSSMTEEEWNDYKSTWKLIEHDLEDTYEPCIESFDWLNANYFDYRGLIEKGLALEAPKGMYGKEEQ